MNNGNKKPQSSLLVRIIEKTVDTYNSIIPGSKLLIKTGPEKDALEFKEILDQIIPNYKPFKKEIFGLRDRFRYPNKDFYSDLDYEEFIDLLKQRYIIKSTIDEKIAPIKKLISANYALTELQGNHQDDLIKENNRKAKQNWSELEKYLKTKLDQTDTNTKEIRIALEKRVIQLEGFEQNKHYQKQNRNIEEYNKKLNESFEEFSRFFREEVIKAEGRTFKDIISRNPNLRSKVKLEFSKLQKSLRNTKLNPKYSNLISLNYEHFDDIVGNFTATVFTATGEEVESEVSCEINYVNKELRKLDKKLAHKAKHHFLKFGLVCASLVGLVLGPGIYSTYQTREKVKTVVSPTLSIETSDVNKKPEIRNLQYFLMDYKTTVIDQYGKIIKKSLKSDEAHKQLLGIDKKYFQYGKNWKNFVLHFLNKDLHSKLNEKMKEKVSKLDHNLFFYGQGSNQNEILENIIKTLDKDFKDPLILVSQKKYLSLLHNELWAHLSKHEIKSAERLNIDEIASLIFRKNINEDNKNIKSVLSNYSLDGIVQQFSRTIIEEGKDKQFMNIDDLIKASIKHDNYLIVSDKLPNRVKHLRFGFDHLILPLVNNNYTIRRTFNFRHLVKAYQNSKKNKGRRFEKEIMPKYMEITRFAKTDYPFIEMTTGFDKENRNAILKASKNGESELLEAIDNVAKLNYIAWIQSQPFTNQPFTRLDFYNDPKVWLTLKKIHDDVFMDLEKRRKLWNFKEVFDWDNEPYLSKVDKDIWYNVHLKTLGPHKDDLEIVDAVALNQLYRSSETYETPKGVKFTQVRIYKPEYKEMKAKTFKRLRKNKVKNLEPKKTEYEKEFLEILPKGNDLLYIEMNFEQIEKKFKKNNLKKQMLKVQKKYFQNFLYCIEQDKAKIITLGIVDQYLIDTDKKGAITLLQQYCLKNNKEVITGNHFLTGYEYKIKLK